MRTKLRSKFTLLFIVLAALLAVPAIALADDIANNLDSSIDAVAETMPLMVGGANGTTTLYVTARNGDGKNGCNLTSSSSLGLSVSSSNTAVATVSPSSVTFTSCGDTPTLTVTPHNQGSATISVTQTSNTTGGTFNLAPATFTVNVAPPPNTAPTIAVAGVSGGASYNKGSVPNATCQVTDAEDGNSSFAATLSPVSGPYASDGIGSQSASCSYNDGGGLTASASETYTIVDPSGPVITKVVTPASPDGSNGWYKSDVTVDWTVSDPQSPNSVQVTGCADQNITSDQAETTYSCSATSAGGSAGPVSVTIKRDATAPGVNCGSADGNWHATDVNIACTASDARSGLADATNDASFNLSTNVAAGNETNNASTNSRTVLDNAGNSATAGPISGVKVDRKAPALVSDGPTSGPDGSNFWYKSAVTNSFTATDGGSGFAPSGALTYSFTKSSGTNEGAAVKIASGAVSDAVGNSTASIDSAAFKIDLSDPYNVTFQGGPAAGGSYDFGNVPAAPTCTASDDVSGFASCNVTGYSNAVGPHTMTATATDTAGRTATETRSYTVKPWNLYGFYQPVDMGETLNTVKNGSTVPVKFELFQGTTELTSTSAVSSVVAKTVYCAAFAGDPADAIEMVTTGGTSLRYDTTGGQFIYNWQTPKKVNTCYNLTMTAADGSTITAYFKLK